MRECSGGSANQGAVLMNFVIAENNRFKPGTLSHSLYVHH
jgi:hypothetical protein